MPKPEAFEMFVIGISDPKNLAPAIDAQRKLGLQRIVNHCHGFNAFLALARSFGYPTLLNGKQFLSQKDIECLAAEQGLAPWTFVGGICGTSRQVKANKSEITKRLSALGQLVFIGDISQKLLNLIVRGVRRPACRAPFIGF